MRPLLVPLVLLAVACDPTVRTGAADPDSDAAPTRPSPTGRRAASPPARPEANVGRVPLPDADKATVCGDDGLLLTRYSLTTVRTRFPELCCTPEGTPDDPRCEAGFLPDPVPCERWAELSAHLLARYGHVFGEDRWNERFAKESWYAPNPAFATGDMSIAAKRNAVTLRRFYAEKIDCSPADDG
jgi:hypothetical protein